ncbi:MAG: metallophosphoesterase family protein [Anaerolineales bacterium]|jgi:diadenosine tetraphosphatase ApaH/serine/threonine PP2A family protein phosphatase
MRILVISDIHGNLPALESVLAEAGQVDQVWCLGDLIGYGPYPNEVVDRIRLLPGLLCLVGNHDKAGLGQIDLEAFNHEAREALEWTQESLSDSSRAFLGSLPEKLTRGQFTLAHGSPRRPVWEYLLDTERARASFGFFGTPYCLVGHSHVALAFRLSAEGHCVLHLPPQGTSLGLGEERMIFNPGSVGQPRDQDPRASYALLDTDQRLWEWRRVGYDVKRVQDQMRSCGLPARLALRLTEGW